MPSEFVEGELKSLGMSGAIISVLMGVIVVLSGVIAIMYRQANKVYGYRLAERDTLKDALNDSKLALKEMIEATKDRNEITEELSDLIAKQSVAFATLELTVTNHYTNLKEDHIRLHLVVSSVADGLRTLTAVITDVRNSIANLGTDIKQSIGSSLTGFAGEVRSAIAAALRLASRKTPK